MKEIKRKNVIREIKKLEKILKKHDRMDTKAKQELENLGYEEEILGTGYSAYTCSKYIGVMDIKSKCYLNGEYLVVGMCNLRYGRYGHQYRGMVKKVIENKFILDTPINRDIYEKNKHFSI